MAEHYRICSICEAGCGLRLQADGRRVVEIRGNADDVFSQGHSCAKGLALAELDTDPDRLRSPLIREGNEFREASWEEAYQYIGQRLQEVRSAHTDQSVAAYIGNPTAHNVGLSFGMSTFLGALGTRQIYSAGTVDQVPKQLACELLFGNDMAIPVPDILRADCVLMLGANPVVSNGSLWLIPKVRDRIRELKARGGRLVTVDPRRTETARLADAHHFIRPGSDAWLLIALIQRLRDAGVEVPPSYPLEGWRELMASLDAVSLEEASMRTGLTLSAIDDLTQELLAAQHPVVYGRVGTTLQRFGTLTSFLLEILNLLLGAVDRAGGAMFPEQPYHMPFRPSDGVRRGRYTSRVSGYPEVLGQMPVAALAEEIETPGDGQVRALFCFAGNPLVSNPDSHRLKRALESLELLVCVDLYHNETSRLAHVILPGTSPFEEGHYDHFLGAMGYRNAARYSPPMFAAEQPDEWQVGLSLAFASRHGRGPSPAELAETEDAVVAGAVSALLADPSSGIHGADLQAVMAAIEPRHGVQRLLDLGVRAGRFGDHFGRRQGLTLAQMAAQPNGIDLGLPRAGRLAEVVQHPDGHIDAAPPLILQDLARLTQSPPHQGLLLVGRRSTRMNNSWLRNLPMLASGIALCTLHMHPQDAAERGLEHGDVVCVRSATGEVQAPVEITDTMMPGVVSLPHGFSEAQNLRQRRTRPGANYNALAAAGEVDVPSGTSALNGVRVEVLKG